MKTQFCPDEYYSIISVVVKIPHQWQHNRSVTPVSSSTFFVWSQKKLQPLATNSSFLIVRIFVIPNLHTMFFCRVKYFKYSYNWILLFVEDYCGPWKKKLYMFCFKRLIVCKLVSLNVFGWSAYTTKTTLSKLDNIGIIYYITCNQTNITR